MDYRKPLMTPLTGPLFYGTFDQRRAIERWAGAGWTFLHWTEVPKIMAVLESPLGEIVNIDDCGAWKGPIFNKSKPVSHPSIARPKDGNQPPFLV